MKKKYTGIIGRSRVMDAVYSGIEIAAANRVNVLILGETGTGKELIARAIHDNSPRRHNSYVKVDCVALPETLMESELFGYKKGAFTDARYDKPGKLEIADGGTVLLDEIGDLPLSIQAKLLRFLEEHAFEPLGSTVTQHVDVRIIAATNRDLVDMIKSGKFRQDLYYRMNVFPVHVPPLRTRQEDIILLTGHFLDMYCRHYGRGDLKFSTEILDRFIEHEWPGNVRQLRHVIEYAVLKCKDNTIKTKHLPDDFFEEVHIQAEGPVTKDDYLKTVVEKTIRKNNGNRNKTCRELRISRTTLWRWIKKYNIIVS